MSRSIQSAHGIAIHALWLFVAALMAMALPAPARAAIVYPWCSSGLSDVGAPSCGYSSEAQCLANSRRCQMNPFYEPPAAGPSAQSRTAPRHVR